RMGLFVVGRLASRHGVEVSLHGGKDIPGVRATVTVPAELVTPNAAEAQTEVLRATPETNGHAKTNGFVPSPLPRRTKPANGSSTPDIARRLLGEDPPKPASEPAAPEERLPLPMRSPGAR